MNIDKSAIYYETRVLPALMSPYIVTHRVWMQSMGLPTRWRVVRAALAANSAAVVAPQCRRNAIESIFGFTPC